VRGKGRKEFSKWLINVDMAPEISKAVIQRIFLSIISPSIGKGKLRHI
jgi:hypothetical protein